MEDFRIEIGCRYENVWVISDTHFGHENIKKYEPIRPSNFEEVIFNNLRTCIGKDDLLIHLGDVLFKDPYKWGAEIKALPFDKIMVKGNHDKKDTWFYNSVCGFKAVIDYYLIIDKILFSHYPRLAAGEDTLTEHDNRYIDRRMFLDRIYRDAGCRAQVHGHTHSRCHPDWYTYINVSVECTKFFPVSLDAIKDRIHLPEISE